VHDGNGRVAHVVTTHWVCMGQQFTRRSDALLTFFRAGGTLRAAAPIVDQGLEGSFCNNADVAGATGGRASGWQGAKEAYRAIQRRHTAATPDWPTTTPTPPLPACSISLHY